MRLRGRRCVCFVTLKKGDWDHEALGKELRQWVAHEIGSFARPEEIRFQMRCRRREAQNYAAAC